MNNVGRQMTHLIASLVLCCVLPCWAGETAAIKLISTTTTENSGLLRYLLPKFSAETGLRVHSITMGSGQALRSAQEGNADILLVHEPSAEIQFVAAGHGHSRTAIMANDFILVGPNHDPAGILHNKENTKPEDILLAFRRLEQQKSLFISRADNSGTHRKEISIWQQLQLDSNQFDSQYYRQSGTGMGHTLNIAANLNAYTLTDRGTWLNFNNKQNLVIVSQGDSLLHNPYHAILLNPKRYPELSHQHAQQLLNWLISPSGKTAISNYKIHGQTLFFPTEKHPASHSNQR